MKRGIFFGILIVLLILNLSFAIAAGNETDDKAYECLEDKVGDCSSPSLSPEAKIFSLLAIGECKDEITSDSKYKSDIKFTAQAILALDKVNVDTTTEESWLLEQNINTSNIDWILQIEITEAITEPTTCTITYGSSSGTITVNVDKTLSGATGCFSLYDENYRLKISSICYGQELTISCKKDFLTNLWYKKTDSATFHVSADTHTASATGTTTEKVNSLCFKKEGDTCNYEAGLWAALVLNFEGYDISSYLPYLITMADENQQYLPESFLYSLTNDFRNELLSKPLPVSDDKYYDTALKFLPFQSETLTEKTDAIDWLAEVQGTDGCWDGGNIRNTAFILYSIWPRGLAVTNGDESIDCEDAGYYCMSLMSCSDAEGEVLSDYTGCFASKCCSKERVLDTCSEQGGKICDSDKTCSISTVEASDTTECCLGSCQVPSVTPDCELYGDGSCSTSCYSDEEITEDYDCNAGEVCCVEKTISEQRSYWWIWVLLVLIVLVVMGIIFRDKLRPVWFKLKSKFRKSKPGPKPGPRGFPPRRPGMPPQRVRPRRILPPAQRKPVKRPVAGKPRKDMDDVLKKLKEMGK